MKEFINGFKMPELTWKQKAIVWYFGLSFCLLGISDESPLWLIVAMMLNFANAVRLARKVPFPENTKS